MEPSGFNEQVKQIANADWQGKYPTYKASEDRFTLETQPWFNAPDYGIVLDEVLAQLQAHVVTNSDLQDRDFEQLNSFVKKLKDSQSRLKVSETDYRDRLIDGVIATLAVLKERNALKDVSLEARTKAVVARELAVKVREDAVSQKEMPPASTGGSSVPESVNEKKLSEIRTLNNQLTDRLNHVVEENARLKKELEEAQNALKQSSISTTSHQRTTTTMTTSAPKPVWSKEDQDKEWANFEKSILPYSAMITTKDGYYIIQQGLMKMGEFNDNSWKVIQTLFEHYPILKRVRFYNDAAISRDQWESAKNSSPTWTKDLITKAFSLPTKDDKKGPDLPPQKTETDNRGAK